MSLNLRDDMEPPPQPGKYSTGIGIFLGLLLTLGLHFMQLVLLPLAYASEGIFKERAFVPLFFFGFTQCPDICPTTLLEVSNDLAALGPKGDALRMVFVSVDERDTAEHLKAYLKSFDPRIVGLTGTPEEIVQITRAYRVFHQKVPTSSGYTINHTATVYLMGADGHLVGTLNFQEPHETQMRKLKRLVGD